MSYDYSENILVQESAGHLLEDELGWRVELAYNTEILGETGTFGRKSYKEILLVKYFRQALSKLNPWLTPALLEDAIKTFESHKLIQQVVKYHKQLELWKKEIESLLPQKGQSAAIDKRILELDSKLEKSIDGHAAIPDEVKNDLKSNKLDELIDKIDLLLKED